MPASMAHVTNLIPPGVSATLAVGGGAAKDVAPEILRLAKEKKKERLKAEKEAERARKEAEEVDRAEAAAAAAEAARSLAESVSGQP
jgi:hypothetical protein